MSENVWPFAVNDFTTPVKVEPPFSAGSGAAELRRVAHGVAGEAVGGRVQRQRRGLAAGRRDLQLDGLGGRAHGGGAHRVEHVGGEQAARRIEHELQLGRGRRSSRWCRRAGAGAPWSTPRRAMPPASSGDISPESVGTIFWCPRPSAPRAPTRRTRRSGRPRPSIVAAVNARSPASHVILPVRMLRPARSRPILPRSYRA